MDETGGLPWGLALGMMLVFEGLLPLLVPGAWREMVQRIAAFEDGQIRFVGLLAVGSGLLVMMVFS